MLNQTKGVDDTPEYTSTKGVNLSQEIIDGMFKKWAIDPSNHRHKHYKKFTHVLCTFFFKFQTLCKLLILKLKKRTHPKLVKYDEK